MALGKYRRGNRVKKIKKLRREERLEDVVELFLSEWSDFQKALIRLCGIRKLQYSADVFDFFATTLTNSDTASEPNVEDLGEMLGASMLARIHGLIVNYSPCYKVAEELLTLYHDCKSKECSDESENMGDPKWLSIESQSTFKQGIDRILSEWEKLQDLSEYFPGHYEILLTYDLLRFFKNPGAVDDDDLAERMHKFMITELDSLIDFSSCKKAASYFWAY